MDRGGVLQAIMPLTLAPRPSLASAFAGKMKPDGRTRACERITNARFIERGSPFGISTRPSRAEFIGA